MLHYVSYAAALITFSFVTLSLASGLLYVAEVIEEHSQSAKRYGKQIIYSIIGAHLLFCFFDGLPIKLTLLGITCHLVYLSNFSRSWPFISLTSPSFVASCVLVILDHFAWFFYFAERAREPRHHSYGGARHVAYRNAWDDPRKHAATYGDDMTFMDVATFFGLCVWLVPFYLFLSLSANDNILPSLGEGGTTLGTPAISAQPPTPTTPNTMSNSRSVPSLTTYQLESSAPPQGRSSLLKSILETVLSALPSVRRGSGRTSSRPNEGLIASPSLSQPPSPALSTGANWGSPMVSYFPNSPTLAAGSPPGTPPSAIGLGRPFALANGDGSTTTPPMGSASSMRSRSGLNTKPPTPRRAHTTGPSDSISPIQQGSKKLNFGPEEWGSGNENGTPMNGGINGGIASRRASPSPLGQKLFDSPSWGGEGTPPIAVHGGSPTTVAKGEMEGKSSGLDASESV